MLRPFGRPSPQHCKGECPRKSVPRCTQHCKGDCEAKPVYKTCEARDSYCNSVNRIMFHSTSVTNCRGPSPNIVRATVTQHQYTNSKAVHNSQSTSVHELKSSTQFSEHSVDTCVYKFSTPNGVSLNISKQMSRPSVRMFGRPFFFWKICGHLMWRDRYQ